jgi:hypothetical protein
MKRRIALLTLLAAVSVVAGAGCFKKAPDTAQPAPAPVDATKTEAALSTPGTGGMTPQQIADTMSKAVCKRMTTCNPQGGSETDCVSGLSKDMAVNLSDKAKAITQAALDTCVGMIAKATCEQLSSDKAPGGCDFMD